MHPTLIFKNLQSTMYCVGCSREEERSEYRVGIKTGQLLNMHCFLLCFAPVCAPVRGDKRAFVQYKGALLARRSPSGAETYTWPSSWAIVKEELRPFSSLMEQLRYGSHIVPSSASPK